MTRREFIGSGIGAMSIAAIGSPTRGRLGSRNVYDIGSQLPYDSEVEYLGSTGTQRIVFDGSRILAGSVIHVKWQFSDVVAQQRIYALNGAGNSLYVNSELTMSVAISSDWGTLEPRRKWDLGPFIGIVPMGPGVAEIVTASGLKSTRNLTSNALLGQKATLFASRSDGQYSMKGKIWHFYVTYNGERIIDMRPVRFTNELGQTEGAMYDRISGELFRNQGTGSFIIGPDV